jgi:Tfp pilus assembly protein PilV
MRRGSTLIETMVASAVLILGMVGVIQLMISGVRQFGRSNARAQGQELSTAALAEDMAKPFAAIPVGVSDAGFVTVDGQRYGRIRTVIDVGDGGVAARQIVVVTNWAENLGSLLVPRTASATTIISELPDAGP